MKNMIWAIVGVVLLLGLSYWYLGKGNQNSTHRKAYAISGATLDTEVFEVKHKLVPPGRSEMLFLIPLSNGKYLTAKVVWAVIPNAVPTIEEGSVFTMQEGNFTPVSTDFKYNTQTGSLEGSLQGESFFFEQNDIIPINSKSDFRDVVKLPGWERVVYKEYDN